MSTAELETRDWTGEKPHLIRFPGTEPPTCDQLEAGPDPSYPITVAELYLDWILPQIQHRSARTLAEHRVCLNHWQRFIGDIDIRQVNRSTLEKLRDGLIPGRSTATVNKTWRTLRMIFTYAHDIRLIERIPQIALGMKCNLVQHRAKFQREPVTADEVDRLWHACSNATYPHNTVWPAPILWRVALLLFYVYGPRTGDVFSLTWENVRFTDRTLRFQAMKTRKVQALPLTEQVMRHLKAVSGRSRYVLPGFVSKGSMLTRGKHAGEIKRGYYSTWNDEILPAAKIDPPIKLKNFRETMVTRYNRIEPGLGGWIAGHSVPGVTAMHYDLPTHRIWEVLEATRLPSCFDLDVI